MERDRHGAERRPGFPAAVTGLGLVTAAGIGVAANWARVLAGVPTAARISELAGLPCDFGCTVPGFDAEALLGADAAWSTDRFVQLALVAVRQALADAGWDPACWDGTRVGVVFGNSHGGKPLYERQVRRLAERGPSLVSPMLVPMTMVNMVAGSVAIDCRAGGPSMVTATACASGCNAVGTAREWLRTGRCDVVVAGGAESAMSPALVASMCRMRALSERRDDPAGACRPFHPDRDGMVGGEGAGVLVLEREDDARARGARVRATITGYGAATDAYRTTAPHPDGAGAERALRAALADAGLRPTDIDHVNTHGTGTRLSDAVESAMLHRVLGPGPAATSTKPVTGHTLGAAGAIEAAFTVLAAEHGRIPPTANLDRPDPAIALDVVTGRARRTAVRHAVKTSLGFGGHNAALIVSAC
ncbi:beta-ketoacyl-[acyl-carrier-protein] synthase family protein [Kitasatospora sp. NPDC052896]|uniref:beta-ketoacyl-[acyl-carrier-protein] synthase family protein n=1 Tax=Kitasatospora sp. NPDC052896 TaxID=3364061 RepID=UPI0037C937A9